MHVVTFYIALTVNVKKKIIESTHVEIKMSIPWKFFNKCINRYCTMGGIQQGGPMVAQLAQINPLHQLMIRPIIKCSRAYSGKKYRAVL